MYRRFQKLDTNKQLINYLISALNEIGYTNIPDDTGGDQDFLMIDTLRMEYIWCENGFMPFCSHEEMEKFDFVTDRNLTLKTLEKSRNTY